MDKQNGVFAIINKTTLVSGTIEFRYRTIDFPNLGIHLKSVGDHITVFEFDIAYYGIVIGIGILAGLMMAVMEAKRTHQNVEDYNNLAIYGVIFSIIGARAYYVIFSWDMYKDDIKSIINIREGGLAIYGGVITGQMIGRWGNFFNREAFGEYKNGLFAMRLPVDAVRSSDITTKMWNHAETVNRSAVAVKSWTSGLSAVGRHDCSDIRYTDHCRKNRSRNFRSNWSV